MNDFFYFLSMFLNLIQIIHCNFPNVIWVQVCKEFVTDKIKSKGLKFAILLHNYDGIVV